MKEELKIVALAPHDGWAFVEEKEGIFLLRPPYTVSAKFRCTAKELEESVLKHGFHSVDYSFCNFSELIQFIKNEYIRANKESGKTVPTVEELKELLSHASEDTLLGFLERAETELIPDGKIEAAESIALDLVKLDKVRENKSLHAHAVNIIDRCAAFRRTRSAWEMKFKKRRLKEIFSNIVEKYPEEQIIEKIETTHHRGVVFSLP